ncbi:MAG: TRAP transporter fused permease subunit [Firmicutes bacterium]|nr:TRAP transporter fused permease subunit [Bacillota bacterium]
MEEKKNDQVEQMAETAISAPAPGLLKAKRIVNYALLAFIPLFCIWYVEIGWRVGLSMYKQVYTMVLVAVVQLLVYLNFPANRKKRQRGVEYMPNILDIILGLIGFGGALYVALDWENIYFLGGFGGSKPQIILGILFTLVVLESARRAVGLPLPIVAIVFIVYTLVGNKIPGLFHTAKFTINNAVGYMYLSASGIFGTAAQTICETVLAFTIFGCFLQKTNAGKFFLDLSVALVGKMRGGAGKVAIFCSMLFATMTGEPSSNLGIIGPLSLPIMRKLNYDPLFSGAVLAVSSCGSMLMPPVMGAVVFLMGEMTGLGFAKIMVAAIIPAFLYYFSIYMQVDLYSAKNKYPRMEDKDIPKIKDVLKEGWYFFVPIAVLCVFLLGLHLTPSKSVLYSTVVLIAISVIRKQDRDVLLSGFWKTFPTAGQQILNVVAVTSCSGIIMALVSLTGIGLRMSSLLTIISGGNLIILALLAAVTIYIMGMGMAPIVSYILMSILVAPALVDKGVPLIAAHFFILYMSVSGFITPPVCLAAYISGGMVGRSGVSVGFKAMRFGIVCYLVPFVCLFAPELLLVGTPLGIIESAVTAIIGVIILAAGLEGYLIKDASIAERVLYIAGGALLFYPGLTTDAIGAVAAVAAIVLQFIRKKKTA